MPAIAFAVTVCHPLCAQSLFNLGGTGYSQDFDGSGTVAGVNALPAGWVFNQAPVFTGGATASTQGAGTVGTGALGGSSAGGAYFFVNGDMASATDRAMGYLTSGSFSNNRNIVFGFTNQTGQPITQLALAFSYEKFRAGLNSRDWAFFASSDELNWGSAYSGGGQSYGGDADNSTVFQPPLSAAKSFSIPGLSIAPGTSFFLRWNYNGSGSGSGAQALGLDDLVLTATLGGAQANLYWDTNGATAGTGGSGVWSATAASWNGAAAGTGAPVVQDSARPFVFGGTAGTVTIGAGAGANAGMTIESDGYTFVGGALSIGGAAPAISVVSAGHAAVVAAGISGAAGLRKTGLGRLALTGANTFTGGTTVSAGTLEIGADSALGAATGGVVIAGGKLRVTANVTLGSQRAVSGAGAVEIPAGAVMSISGPADFGGIVLTDSGTLRLAGAVRDLDSVLFEAAGILDSAGGAITLGGPFETTHLAGTVNVLAGLNLGNVARIFDIADGLAGIDLTLTGALTGGGAGRLQKYGPGTLDLLGDNSGLLGGMTLGSAGAGAESGGTLILHDDTALGAPTGGAFEFNAGTLFAATALTGANRIPVPQIFFGGAAPLAAIFSGGDIAFSGGGVLVNSGPAHVITAESNVEISGTVSGATPGLSVQGPGSVTFAGGGSFTGDVSVTGRLFFSGGLTGPTRPVITATGAGLLGGDVTGGTLGKIVADGSGSAIGVIAPGTAADITGTLTATAVGVALDIRANGALHIQLGGTSVAEYDRVVVNGEVMLAGALNISVLGGFIPAGGDVFTIILNDGVESVAGQFSGKAESALFPASGYDFRISYHGGDGNDVTLTTVPEPGTGSLLFAATAFLARRRRRFEPERGDWRLVRCSEFRVKGSELNGSN